MSEAQKSGESAEEVLPLPTSPEKLLETLQSLDIAYELHAHEPIFTVAEGEHLKAHIPGIHCRNLFLRDKKKKMFLVVAANETAIDLKKLEKVLECGRLSFGSGDRLWENLGIRQGSVNPFCAINDSAHNVQIILDAYMMGGEIVNYHPMDNAQTIGLTPADLLKFYAHTGHQPRVLDLSAAAPESAPVA